MTYVDLDVLHLPNYYLVNLLLDVIFTMNDVAYRNCQVKLIPNYLSHLVGYFEYAQPQAVIPIHLYNIPTIYVHIYLHVRYLIKKIQLNYSIEF